MDKVLGIIGGMGPLATVKLFENIVLKTEVDKDQDHIHILIDNNTKIPCRPGFILDKSNENPKYELVASAKKLESIGAEFLAMPCNTAHYFYRDIVKEIEIPFINMIEETLIYIEKKYPKISKVALLSTVATIEANVYSSEFEKKSLEILVPSKENQKHINDLIKNVKQGKRELDLAGFYQTIEEMKRQDVEIFIAGCSEISVAIELYDLKGDFIDPLDILTNSIIRYTGREVK